MCRYGWTNYKSHYACFNCRKVFKKLTFKDYVAKSPHKDLFERRTKSPKSKHKAGRVKLKKLEEISKEYKDLISKCPECRGQMVDLGLDFRAPKKNDVQAWNVIQSLYKMGKQFHSCGCSGPGYIPTKKVDYKRYLNSVIQEYNENYQKWFKKTDEDATERKNALIYWHDRIQKATKELESL